MGDYREGDENIRKLQQTGEDSNSYMVTLPIALVRDLGWQVHQKVTIRRDGDKLVVEDWEK